jgi:hypothetical protein
MSIFILNLLILSYVIFSNSFGDMTNRFAALIIFNASQGQLYSDKKIRQINWVVSIFLIILIYILGYKFDYFKY